MYQLVTVEEMKNYLEVEAAITDFDLALPLYTQSVTDRFEQFLNREFFKKSRTRKFNGGRKLYPLPAYPIDLNITPVVTVDGDGKTLDSDFFVYEEEGDGYIELKYSSSTLNPQNVVITWTGGWETSDEVIESNTYKIYQDIPGALKRACFMQTAFEFKRRKDLGLSSISMPDGSISTLKPAEFLPDVKQTLGAFRKLPSER
jgi:hypothetical protein